MRVLPLAASAIVAAGAPAVASAADLTVNVTVPRINSGSYHRPYVAVWIETPDQNAVRTLAVWYQQTRNAEGDGKDWLKDMRTWWRKGGRAMALPADGVSGATRAPGQHTRLVHFGSHCVGKNDLSVYRAPTEMELHPADRIVRTGVDAAFTKMPATAQLSERHDTLIENDVGHRKALA